MFLDAVLIVLCTGILNHAYKVTDFISFDNLYLFLNSFDSGLLIGAAVYFSDSMDAGKNTISLWGSIYLFQMTALNVYFALSLGFMWFTQKRITDPIEDLSGIAKSYYVKQSDDEKRKSMLSTCEKYSKDSTEAGNLARSYITMIKDMEVYVDNLKNVTAEKERINAALFMAIAKTFLKTQAQTGNSPENVFTYLRSRPGLVLAGMEDIKYRKNEIVLNPKDWLFLYTDGVTEATDSDNELYGEDRLLSYMNRHKDDKLEDVLKGLREDIDAFVGQAPQFDDITMLILSFDRHSDRG